MDKRVKMWLQFNPKYKVLLLKMEVSKQENLVKEKFRYKRGW